ncbi:MAG: hypothetical protein H6867_11475 [Rhodospirillales bacterium]|nr:hypothetical protein [Rhodospirillales bacterium]MCB9996750.1 hypothetical protein [Rhodospirillales bacterium]
MDAAWLKSQFAMNPEQSKADLAKALGLEPPAISKILSGQRQIKAHEYVGMRKFFGLPVDGTHAVQQGGLAGKNYVLSPLENTMKEPAPAASDESWVMPARLFENRTSAPPDQIRIFAVQEDAMAPDILRGENVLVDLSDKKPSPAGTFVVSDGLGHIIRQCEYVPHSDPPEIRLSALNRKYEPYTVKLAKAEIIGRVIAKLQWL